MSDDARRVAIRENFDAFHAQLTLLLETHAGKFAVLHNKEIIEFFDTFTDAARFGAKIYPDGMFSVQEVTDQHINLGMFSIALDNITA
jgi:hypothetical protein